MDSSQQNWSPGNPPDGSWSRPPHPGPAPIPIQPWRRKSSALLFAFFLGDFGAHNFYLSQFVRGTIHLLLLGLGLGLLIQGQKVSAGMPDVAGIPYGVEWHLSGLGVWAINGLWRWVEFFIILARPRDQRVA